MTGRARRLGGVLLLVLGILAMHGLVSDHHDLHGVAGPMTSLDPSGARTGDSGLALADHSLADHSLADHSLADHSVGGHAAAAVGLCLAVLLGAALLRRAGGVGRSAAPPTCRTPAVRTAPPGRGPPRLLLAQLCVLRT